ncbi:hypothetical protein RA307_02575 [Xanthobacteraceae bacterium Astr-EGSB]|uniref:hypothetical protein n=1 Tax=Astrobacterium formosum TaxID=3069710 RepID=UPI0027B47611|nr:hypothetical protein [Xanthobacteraceae bacterium Astr-EGSB]
MKILEILVRAQTCYGGLPERSVSEQTMLTYRRTFLRMWREPVLDPLRPGDARDTYEGRRAALHTVSRILLEDFIDRCVKAGERNDIAAVQHAAAVLVRLLDRITPALALDPPLLPDASPWEMPASRWQMCDGSRPQRGEGSKKLLLPLLPRDWRERMWTAAPTDWPYLSAMAVHILTPARPEELVPGERPTGWSSGVEVELLSPGRMAIRINPVKSHDGEYGIPDVGIHVDPVAAGDAALHLARLCNAAGGMMVVSISSKNAMRKALERLGKRALPEVPVTITPYVFRHQAIADLKATVGAGGDVAVAAGHCTDRTQSHYGRVEHGRKSKGFIGVKSSRKPQVGNVERGAELAANRRARKRRPTS